MGHHTFDAKLDLKSIGTDGETWGEFTGTISTSDEDAHSDRLAENCFRPINPDNVALLWAHDSKQPLGKWSSIVQSGSKLIGRGKLLLSLERAREVYTMLKSGVVNGLSVGFSVRDPKNDIETVGRKRIIKRAFLHECSVVCVPANAHARIHEVRSLADGPSALATSELLCAKFVAQSRLTGDILFDGQARVLERLAAAAIAGELGPNAGAAVAQGLKALTSDLKRRRAR